MGAIDTGGNESCLLADGQVSVKMKMTVVRRNKILISGLKLFST